MSPTDDLTAPPQGHAPATGAIDGAPAEAPDHMPAPGALHLVEKRTWKTWQLALAVVLAAVVGMALNYHTVGSSQASTSRAYTLPPPAASSGSTTTSTPASGGSTAKGTATTTTTPGGVTTTTAPASGTTTPTTAGVARVLLASPQQSGNWTSTAFTTTAANWNIGWAFRCTPPPAGGPSFQIFVVPAGGKPSATPAVTQTGASGQSVTAQSTLGSQTLMVETSASCVWIVKVTGS